MKRKECIAVNLKGTIDSSTFDNDNIINPNALSASITTGEHSISTVSGFRAIASSTGERGVSIALGDCSTSIATGYKCSVYASSPTSVAISLGIFGRAKGVKGSTLIIGEYKLKKGKSGDLFEDYGV